ncbi:hypothetical protein ACHAXT_003413 [Thalassiosira profunda]
MVTASAVATVFLTFEGVLFGAMMSFALVAPADFAAGVLEIATEDLALIAAGDASVSDATARLATFAAVDCDNQHGFVVFACIIAIHAGLFTSHSQRLPVFVAFVAAHAIVVWNQTMALSGNYYIGNLHEPVLAAFGPARALHSFFLLGHACLASTLLFGGGGKAHKKE